MSGPQTGAERLQSAMEDWIENCSQVKGLRADLDYALKNLDAAYERIK